MALRHLRRDEERRGRGGDVGPLAPTLVDTAASDERAALTVDLRFLRTQGERADARCTVRVAQVELLTLRYRRGIGGPLMGPILQDSANGAAAPQAAATASAETRRADRAFSLRSVRSLASPSEARLNERLARLLGQKRGSDVVMVGVLCAALFLGLIGLAVHFLWVVAIIVMALGLGYAVANSRRDRIDVVNQRAEAQSERIGDPR
jgi:hypothetical protein